MVQVPGFATAADMMLRPLAPELIADSIPKVGLGQIIGQSYAGKSYVALDLGWRVSCGFVDWFGHEILAPGPVVYWIGEGAGGIPSRLRALNEFYGQAPERYAFITELEMYPLSPSGLPKFVEAVQAFCEGDDPAMVIVDTQATVMESLGITDENNNAEVSRATTMLKRTAEELNTAFTLIHHTGKDASRGARGASAQFSNIDWQATVTIQGEAPQAKHYLKIGKHKDGLAWPDQHEFFLRKPSEDSRSPVVIPGDAPTVSFVDQLAEAKRQAELAILSVLRSAGSAGMSKAELSAATDMPDAKCGQILTGMLEDGSVRKEGKTRNTRYFAEG